MIDYVGIAYATTVAAGGVFGYLKAGSAVSLGAGLLFGVVLGYGAYQISNNPSDIYVSLTASSILFGVMGYRYYSTQKFMPAGLTALISGAMILKLGLQGILLASNKTTAVPRNE